MKDFSRWHALEQALERDAAPPAFRECEIWWCALGLNIGAERDGKNDLFERPVLVFRKLNGLMFWGLPMSSAAKRGPFNYLFDFRGRRRSVSLSQIRALSAKRLVRRVGKVSDSELARIGQAFFRFARLG